MNLVQVALLANGNMERFYKILDTRLDLAKEAILLRYNNLKGTKSDVAPILWQHGALARLEKGEVIDSLLENGYASYSLGYIGVYETSLLMTGDSHTKPEGEKFAIELLKYLKAKTEEWTKETTLGIGLYATPSETLCMTLAELDRKTFGDIPGITDKGFYMNSFHVAIDEEIDAFSKFKFEGQFHPISSSGCISYIESPNLIHNPEVIETLIKYVYDTVTYGEFNTRQDHCHVCHFQGEIKIVDMDIWECPNCYNRDQEKMTVLRRTCGYIGENFWNKGKTAEIARRRLHL